MNLIGNVSIFEREMNPINPLDWVKSAQDWFRTTELSSGFRPYLIFLLICVGSAITLLTFFSTTSLFQIVAAILLTVPFLLFIALFAIKAFQDPQFCRSERHVEKIFKLEIGALGPETIQIDAHVVEKNFLTSSKPDQIALPEAKEKEGAS